MARKTPPDRLSQLVECATRVFIEQGYRRTQMADVAEALGVAKGTLYLYVESKDALFDLVVRCADGDHELPELAALPLHTPAAGSTAAHVRERLAANQEIPALTAALRRTRVRDVRAELEDIVAQLYDRLAHHRRGIKLLDRSAVDHRELAALWFEQARGGMHAALVTYLDARIQRRLLPPVPDVAIAARMLLETVVVWAVHRHWDPHPQPMEEAVVRASVIRFVVGGLASRPAPRGRAERQRKRDPQ
jgi:AcrR family transcriptional regulator